MVVFLWRGLGGSRVEGNKSVEVTRSKKMWPLDGRTFSHSTQQDVTLSFDHRIFILIWPSPPILSQSLNLSTL